ncbi:MAG: ROK family protein [Clostridiales bacterium]
MKKYAGKPHLLKEINLSLIQQIIKEKGPISKPDIASHSKLSLPTVNKNVEYLLECKVIILSGTKKSGLGRKPNLYEINIQTEYILAIYFKNDFLYGSVCNMLGNIQDKNKVKINFSSKNTILENIFKLIDSFVNYNKNIKAIGLAVPGVVKKDGSIYNIPNITGWEGINIKKILQEKYKLDAFIDNDVNLETIGIYHNHFVKKYRNIVCLYFGMGVGAGVIIDKKLYRGASNFAGEISYMLTRNVEDKELFDFKSKGLMEEDITRIIDEIICQAGNGDTSYSLTKIFEDKTGTFENKIEELTKKISFLIINITCILNPEIIVLDGIFICEKFISMLKVKINKYIDEKNQPELVLVNDENAKIFGMVNLCLSGINSNFCLIDQKEV